ncbi:MAG: sigma-70 family RNA polymerase sigma factor [Acidobacteria bacterium]|nr:sigma-70 family RNA polymerase sigma factor [Acidobacteriota bacterium]
MAYKEIITRLLNDLGAGRREAFDELLPLVYDELRRTAHRQLLGEPGNHTINTTALVHEAYLKLVDRRQMGWQNRNHFYAVAAQAMRRILVSYARRRKAEKRGGGAAQVVFDEAFGVFSDERSEELVALDEALEHLEQINPRHARIVECRFFGGLTIEETATALDVSSITVTRDWRMARAWLKDALNDTSNR